MAVSSICNHNVATIDPDADIAEAAERMRKEHVGDLIVARFEDARLVPQGSSRIATSSSPSLRGTSTPIP